MVFAVLEDVLEEVLLVGEFLVVLEVVQAVLEDAVVDAVLVLVGLVRLLPLQVDEQLLAVTLHPPLPRPQHPSHQLPVVPAPDVVLQPLLGVRGQLALGDGVGPFRLLPFMERGLLDETIATLRIAGQ